MKKIQPYYLPFFALLYVGFFLIFITAGVAEENHKAADFKMKYGCLQGI